ncbi:substrate-binding domain-containing protein [uncultured Flavonifractor sp.]|uniref:substrate-binding domain-containing protein n=1 Tax=uncultured Flavonifractor sp. TaxID=1193534 RepID=UPI00262BE8BA|nr:substrate-binding domain-containing protein [uncultured Flavonifractor sp.]
MNKKKLVSLLLALAMVFALGACGGDTQGNQESQTPSTSSPSGENNASSGDAKVAVFYYNYADTYIASVRTALDAALDAAGVTYQDFDGNNNQTTQNEAIDTALADNYNILVVNMVTTGSSDTAKAILDKAAAKGAKVIFFNRAIEEDGAEGSVLGADTYKDMVSFVGTDAPEAGHLQGQMIGEYLLENYDTVDLNGDGVISYAMFKGDEANVEAIYRTQYGVEDANKVLTEAGKPELAYFDPASSSGYQVDMGGAWSSAAALEYMTTNLAQYNETNGNMIELVICNNDNMAEGAISALQAAGYNTGAEGSKTIPVFGVDATDSAQALIAQGVMTGTVKQDAEGMANAICEMVTSTAAGTSMADAAAAIASSNEIYTVAEGIDNKLYVAYAPFTGK